MTYNLTEVLILCYIALLIGMVFGVMLGAASERENQEKAAKLANSVAIADYAERNPEAVPRPPLEVERSIQMRARSGVPGRKA